LGKKWIQECSEKHTECGHTLHSQLPPRVIDVGPPDGSEIPRLVLRGGEYWDYATLSHCWGGSKPVITDSTTIEANMEGIPFESLPKTFQDAVTATRQLGLRYLWIDSLCIIQDSKEDWEKHCFEMPNIYKNSIVTIASPAAADCNVGFLHERPRPKSVSLTISNGEVDQQVNLVHAKLSSPYYPETERDSPLAKRAWVLQERLLSRRILYFRSEFMYFECCTNVWREYLHYPFIDDFQVRSEVTKISFAREQNPGVWLQYWCEIVSTYSESALTFASDRLPAVSGIARELKQKLRDKYLAGLWYTDIPRGLTWYIPFYRDHKAQGYNCGMQAYVAPSWSWASSRCGVLFCDLNYTDHVLVSDIQLIGVDVKVGGTNTLGEVQKGVLTIRGKLQQFTVRSGPDLLVEDRQTLFVCSNKSTTLLGLYHPDEFDGFNSRNSGELASQHPLFEKVINFVYLGYFLSKDSNRYLKWVALAVEAIVGTEDQYRRVGLAYGGDLISFPPEQDLFQDGEVGLIKIV
jgi:hypothetical protein